jgi:hypothetical protein
MEHFKIQGKHYREFKIYKKRMVEMYMIGWMPTKEHIELVMDNCFAMGEADLQHIFKDLKDKKLKGVR